VVLQVGGGELLQLHLGEPDVGHLKAAPKRVDALRGFGYVLFLLPMFSIDKMLKFKW
jgi:hypothetical protein